MNLKQLACLACGVALLIGACSSNNSAGTSSGSGADGAESPSGPVRDTVNLANAEAALTTAMTRFTNAQDVVRRAIAAATAAAAGTGDRAAARELIDSARKAITDAVEAANDAVTAAADGSTADRGAAARALNRANTLRTEQTTALDNALASFGWFGRPLVRVKLLNGEARMPPMGGDNFIVSINRIPRTVTVDGSPVANTGQLEGIPKAFTSTTFKDIMYSDGKKVFSIIDDAEGGDEFKVDGYIGVPDSIRNLEIDTYTGLKLTDAGLVIRTGGTGMAASTEPLYNNDSTDMRKNIARYANDADGDNTVDTLLGQNGWDLELTFRGPHITPVGGGGVSSWTGNSAFYWKSLVPADPRQLEDRGGGATYYNSGAFSEPDGFKDLGTYEVWLSNHIGVDTNLEPPPGAGVVTCPDGSRGASCPSDDTQFYLKYAAYGLFVYTADPQTILTGSFNGRGGRINTIHFGYSAFDDADGERTTDIGEAITSAKFRGYTLAYETRGQRSGTIYTNLLRGDVTLTVSIPKGTSAEILEGTMNNFQRWDEGGYWTAYTNNFSIALSNATISEDGTFSGTVQATPISGLGGVGDGHYKGSFYGPRADGSNLEVAGSWVVGAFTDTEVAARQVSGLDQGTNAIQRDLYGSFGAKQRPADN